MYGVYNISKEVTQSNVKLYTIYQFNSFSITKAVLCETRFVLHFCLICIVDLNIPLTLHYSFIALFLNIYLPNASGSKERFQSV